MQEFLERQREAFARVSKTPGRRGLKKQYVEDLTSQLNHVFSNGQFEMNVFFGQPGMGKRSTVQAAIDSSQHCDSIFYLEIDAEFTQTEYLLLNKIFNLIRAEDPFHKQLSEGGSDSRRKKGRKGDHNKMLDVNVRRDHAYNFLSKSFALDEAPGDFHDGVSNEQLRKYQEGPEDEGCFKELDEQDALSMYSVLHRYFSFFHIVLYVRHAEVFTRTKRQSFFYNILEMSRKKGCRGLIIFETQNLGFLEALEKRNASRMNPRKFIFGDFSLEMEFFEIVRKTMESASSQSGVVNRFIDFLNAPLIRQELSLFLYRDFSLAQMLQLMSAFLRQLSERDMQRIVETHLKELASKSCSLLGELLGKLRAADEELHGDFKVAVFDRNLCETEQIILMIINQYHIQNRDKFAGLIKVKNIENNIANLIKCNGQKSYKMTRELIHMSIENLQRMGLVRLSRRRINLETVLSANIDPNFSKHLSDFKANGAYNNLPMLEPLDKK